MNAAKELNQLIQGYRGTVLLYVAAKLQLADRFTAGGAIGSAGLARDCSVNEDALHRVLRGLAAMEILREEQDGRFALTERGAGLLSSSPDSCGEQALLAGEEYLPSWGALLHTVTTGQTAFDHVFGMSPWQHRSQTPELGAAFDSILFAQTASLSEALLESYDFGGARQIADIGGGQGGFVSAILARQGASEGVLFDLPQVVAQAKVRLGAMPFGNRLQIVEGDFFAGIPAGSDLYVLKSVLHDWNDERCLTILRHCRRAMTSADRLLIIERPLPERAVDDPETIMLDIHMLAVLGGKERSVADYHRLARKAGLEPGELFSTSTTFKIMEFAPTQVHQE